MVLHCGISYLGMDIGISVREKLGMLCFMLVFILINDIFLQTHKTMMYGYTMPICFNEYGADSCRIIMNKEKKRRNFIIAMLLELYNMNIIYYL